MVNYSNGKIYKLECRKTGLVYIGSTAQKLLSTRIGKHKGDYKKFLTKKMNYVSSFEIIKNNDYFYDIIEYYECECKTDLEKRGIILYSSLDGHDAYWTLPLGIKQTNDIIIDTILAS